VDERLILQVYLGQERNMNKRVLILLLIISPMLYAYQVTPQSGRIKISDDLELIKLSENAYIHISYHDLLNTPHFPANGFIYLNHGQALIIDTTWENSTTKMLISWIRDNLNSTIIGIVITHWHVDCMGGLEAVHEARIKSYSHHLTRENAKLKELPVPTIGFKDSLILKVGNKRIHCYYFGPGHTDDNIVIWLPEEKILFAGCMVKALAWKSLGFLGDAHIHRWPETLKELLVKFPEARIVIPGHGQFGDLSLIKHTLKLLQNKR
jgi:metallo-beta-lactamase class B